MTYIVLHVSAGLTQLDDLEVVDVGEQNNIPQWREVCTLTIIIIVCGEIHYLRHEYRVPMCLRGVCLLEILNT